MVSGARARGALGSSLNEDTAAAGAAAGAEAAAAGGGVVAGGSDLGAVLQATARSGHRQANSRSRCERAPLEHASLWQTAVSARLPSAPTR